MQWRPAVTVTGVDVGAVLDQEAERVERGRGSERDNVDGLDVIHVTRVDISTVIKEDAHRLCRVLAVGDNGVEKSEIGVRVTRIDEGRWIADRGKVPFKSLEVARFRGVPEGEGRGIRVVEGEGHCGRS